MSRESKQKLVREAQATYDAGALAPVRDHGLSGSRSPGTMVLGPQRRVVLPAGVIEHLGVDVGERLVYFFNDDGTITLKSTRSVVESLRGIFKDLAPGRSLADELIAERRREAAREDAGL